MCLDAKGERWTCGIAARDRLSSHIASRLISCASRGGDRYGRTLAICSAGGEDLNAWMVREGLALAYVKYSREYVGDEAAAREQRKGMWAVHSSRHGIGGTAASELSSWARCLFRSRRKQSC
jgi:endonuclease YncB( thermonuclease family)